MNISFLTSSHLHFDDRIYHHLADSLSKKGHSIEIVSSISKLKIDAKISINNFAGNSLTKREKIKIFTEKLFSFSPQIIICSEPITVIAAKKYSKKTNAQIIYDITEWYPSKKNLANHSKISKGFHFFKYLFFNIYAAFYSDGFIFGEYYKSKPYKFLFPSTPFTFIPYYPKSSIIHSVKSTLKSDTLRLSYSGKISVEKGFINFLNVLNLLSKQDPKLLIAVKIIGWYDPKEKFILQKSLKNLPDNISFAFYEFQELQKYIELINDTDIFIDLRSNDFENSHCLPIKLFYYIALERPVIYSNLKAIKKEVDIEQFGHLVNPTDTQKIVNLITDYIKNSDLYSNHCSNAKTLFKTTYNWEKIEAQFINFIENFEKNK